MPYRLFYLCCLLLCQGLALAQVVQGTISDGQQPIAFANIRPEGAATGAVSDSLGFYRLRLPAGEHTLVFSHIGYQTTKRSLSLKEGEVLQLSIVLAPQTNTLKAVEVRNTEQALRLEVSKIALNPNALRNMPSPFGDFNQAISMIGLGVSSNSELSSAYSVRGGNYEENLVYVNGIEIYRPFLVRAGEQEGLSFINPDLVQSVDFSSGGWRAEYGDKLSSVLNVAYKNPTTLKASASASLLVGTAHLEGSTQEGKFTYLIGARYKSGRYLFNTLPTQGQYFPNFGDVQGFFTYKISEKTSLSLLISQASNQYLVIPQTRRTDFGTFNRAFRLVVDFQGSESLSYNTSQVGSSLKHRFSDRLTSYFILSALQTREREFINTEGAYRLCDVNTNINSPDFNQCLFVRGAGRLLQYGRNFLEAQILTAENRNEWADKRSKAAWGMRFSQEKMDDILNQYSLTDSADFVSISERLGTQIGLNSWRWSAYAQQTHFLGEKHSLHYGLRLSYWSLNRQWLVSPRFQYSYKPTWKKDITFNAAAGVYQQPPFYREMRDFEGQINRSLKAQASLHLIGGMDWNFKQWNRPFKFITEVYYKQIANVIPYDMDNMRLRYYATNSGRAYAYGADFRLSGEFIQGAESWFNLSLLSTQEDIEGDERGFIRRPTDQRATLTIFFEDHIPDNPSLRVNLRLMYGSGLPFGIPRQPQNRAVFNGGEYRRVDIGFSKMMSQKVKPLESLWIGLDILNLLGAENKISYLWIPDYLGNQYAVPNALSQRFFNLRIIARY